MSRRSIRFLLFFSFLVILIFFSWPKKTILVLGDDFALNWVKKGQFSLKGVKLKVLASATQNFEESRKIIEKEKEQVILYFLSRHQLKHLKGLSHSRILDNKIYHYGLLEKDLLSFFQQELEKGKKILVITRPMEINFLVKDCYEGPIPSKDLRNFIKQTPSSRVYKLLYLEEKKLEDFILASQLDCSCESMEEVFNEIFRKTSSEYKVPLIDFAQFVYDRGSFYESDYEHISKQILYFFQ